MWQYMVLQPTLKHTTAQSEGKVSPERHLAFYLYVKESMTSSTRCVLPFLGPRTLQPTITAQTHECSSVDDEGKITLHACLANLHV